MQFGMKRSGAGWLSRCRRFIGGAALIFAVLASGVVIGIRPAAALVELDITRGNIQPLPIAIPAFIGGELGADDCGGDLRRSQTIGPVRADRSRRPSLPSSPRPTRFRASPTGG